MNGSRIAVVGGGLAGLAAAIDCADAGAAVTLYEGRTRLGGATFSFERNGLWLDNGQHVSLRCCTSYLGVPARGSAAPSSCTSSRGCACRCCARADGRRSSAAPACRRRSTSPPRSLRVQPAQPGRARRRGARGARPAAARSCRPRARPADLRVMARVARPVGQRDRVALEPDRPPDAEPSRRRGLAGGGGQGVPHRPPGQRRGVRHRHPERAVRAAPRASPPRRRSSGPAAGSSAAPRCARHTGPEAAARRRRRRGGRGDRRGPARGARRPRAAGRRRRRPPGGPRHEPDRQPPSSTTTGECSTSPFAAALGSPVQWLFDRTEAAGAGEGQVVAVSLSHAADEIGASVAELRARYVPALERLLPVRARARACSTLRSPTSRGRRSAPHRGRRCCGPARGRRVQRLFLAGAWTDTGWPATMESAVRSGVAAAGAALAELRGDQQPRDVEASLGGPRR